VSGDARTAAMLLGDLVTYQGRRYVVVGVTPMSVRPFSVELSDPETNRTIWVEWPTEPVERAALRLAEQETASAWDQNVPSPQAASDDVYGSPRHRRCAWRRH
jgi:hypothetical protein